MDTSFTTFVASAKDVRLTDSERNFIRGTILSQAARQDIAASDTARPGLFSWVSLFKGAPAMAAFLLVVGVGGGVAYAAEDALPGDLLYSVKINVNEAVMAKLAFTTEDKARLETVHATRRLREAEKLAVNLQLDVEKSSQLQAAFQAHAQGVRRNIALLAADQQSATASDIGNDFQASLEAHVAVMQRLADSRQERRQIASLIHDVEQTKNDTERSRSMVEIAMSTIPSEERQVSAENSLVGISSRLEKLRMNIEKNRGAGDDDQQQEALEKLKQADSTLSQASAKLDSGNYSDGFSLLRHTMRNVEEAGLIRDFGKDLATSTEVTANANSSVGSGAQAVTPGINAPAMEDKKEDIVVTTRNRVQKARDLLSARRSALSAAAVNEATLKLDGATKTLDLAADFSAKGQSEERDSYANAALSAVGYVETFIKEPAAVDAGATAKTDAAASSPSSSSSQSSGQPLATVIFSPRYKSAKKALEDFEGLRDRSRGLLDQQSIDKASAIAVSGQSGLVSAQASFDAGTEADSNLQFDKVLALTKDGTAGLANAAQKAINQSSSSAPSVHSSSSSAAATTSASASISGQASVSSSTQAPASSSASKAKDALDRVLPTPLPVPGL